MERLVTIDVWDTVLRRTCHPECVKLATAKFLYLRHYADINCQYRDVQRLHGLRVESEAHVAQLSVGAGDDDEYKIVDVLRHWISRCYRGEEIEELVAECQRFEKQLEIAVSFVDPEIISWLKQKDLVGSFVFLSDFYMDSSALREILDAKGVGALFVDGVVSCDIGRNKRSGRLYDYIHRRFGVLPELHVHVGDNIWSDVECPKRLGVCALHYLPEAPHAARLHHADLFHSRERLFEYLMSASSREASARCRGWCEKSMERFMDGVRVTPLLIGCVLYIAESALRSRVDVLYFADDEGEVFVKLYSLLFPQLMVWGQALPMAFRMDPVQMSEAKGESSRGDNARALRSRRFQGRAQSVTMEGMRGTVKRICQSVKRLWIRTRRQQKTRVCGVDSRTRILEVDHHKLQLIGSVWLDCAGQEQESRVGEWSPYTVAIALNSYLAAGAESLLKRSDGTNQRCGVYDPPATAGDLCRYVKGILGGICLDVDVGAQRKSLVALDDDGVPSAVSVVDEDGDPFTEGVLMTVRQWRAYVDRYVVSSEELFPIIEKSLKD